MDDIIACARDLGKKIANHPRTASFRDAAKAVNEDSAAQDILKAYDACAKKITDLQRAGKPIEPEDKRALQDCETKIATNPKLKELTKRQADYLEMMNRVNAAIDEATMGQK